MGTKLGTSRLGTKIQSQRQFVQLPSGEGVRWYALVDDFRTQLPAFSDTLYLADSAFARGQIEPEHKRERL